VTKGVLVAEEVGSSGRNGGVMGDLIVVGDVEGESIA